MEKRPRKEVMDELKRLKELTNDPEPEIEKVPLIENALKYKDKTKKTSNQIKVGIPKKFVNFLNIRKETHEAKFSWDKEGDRLFMEIIKKR